MSKTTRILGYSSHYIHCHAFMFVFTGKPVPINPVPCGSKIQIPLNIYP